MEPPCAAHHVARSTRLQLAAALCSRALPCAAAALSAAPTLSAQAQQSSSLAALEVAGSAVQPNQVLAVRVPGGMVRLDGRLDEAAWQTAPPISDFTQKDPDEGQPATERTEARVLYTDDVIYVGVRAFDSQPDRIMAQLTRRDEESPSDWLVIAFDSYHDRRTAFVFWVNPAGVKRDMYLFDDSEDDDSWDAVWDVATSRDGEGWTAEFAIPLSQLRFADQPEHEFGFQVARIIARRNEEVHWRLMPKDKPGTVSLFGDLVGIRGIRPPRRIEVMPYTAASSAWSPAEAGNPYATGQDWAGRAGADVKLGVTSNLTLSATINPDFGQVEADPAVVNLTAFETFYPEKRPFFGEGLDMFRFPILLGDGDNANEQLFYTRRIGRAPQGEADPRGGYAETISQTTILGAGKLSGKTATGWTIGLLGALTAEEEAAVVATDGRRFTDVVEPRSGYLVARLAKDFRQGRTKIGFFGTGVRRSLPENLDWLRSTAVAGGFDWSHRFRDDTYAIDGWVVGSYVRGSAEAIDLTQRSSARYYQRPDNEHVTYDPTRTSLAGMAAQLVVSKNRGNWMFATGFDTRSPGFEVNDAGYQREADRTIQFLWIGRRWLQPGKLFRQAQINFNQHTVWSWGWERLATGGNVNANAQFRNYWNASFGVEPHFQSLSPGALRGGPAFLRPFGIAVFGGVMSDDRKRLRVELGGFAFSEPEADSWAYEVGPEVSWRAASNMDFAFGPGIREEFDAWQYLATEEALGNTHYVFGRLRQTVASMTFRSNVTFTPSLSLQVYAAPFVATGDFQGFREVADPRGRTFDDRFTDFGAGQVLEDGGNVAIDLDANGNADIDLGRPDFTYLSFRSNVVLRWEYKLGSTLFLVWQHGREGGNDDPNPQFRFGQGLEDMFRLGAHNALLIKVNYWFSL